jgi:hypothetical protein
MEQKDYILREIERIGAVIRGILQKFIGGKENFAITIEYQMEEAKGVLLTEINFNLEQFLSLNTEELSDYINNFTGFNAENIELLAHLMFETGFNGKCDNSKKYLEKALKLYELCNLKSGTYSFERESNIKAIKNVL